MLGFQRYIYDYDVRSAVARPDYLTYVGQLLRKKHYGKMKKKRG